MDCAFATATSAAPSALYELADDHEQLLEHAMLPSAGAAFEALAFEPAGLLVPAALLHQHQHQQPGMDVQHLSPSSTASSSLSSAQCRCVIDLSTPATLERDFYAWLQVSAARTDTAGAFSFTCIGVCHGCSCRGWGQVCVINFLVRFFVSGSWQRAGNFSLVPFSC